MQAACWVIGPPPRDARWRESRSLAPASRLHAGAAAVGVARSTGRSSRGEGHVGRVCGCGAGTSGQSAHRHCPARRLAEKLGRGARRWSGSCGARGSPLPGGSGAGCCKRLSTSPCTCAVCGVPCACMLVQGRAEVYTHARAHVCTCMCAVLAFAQAASVTLLPDPKVRGNLGLLNQLTRHLHFSVFCAIHVANRKTNINCHAQ